ncbi:MAG: SNF2-related protein [Ruminococcus sp.]|nr:SNF2-related protein [Ruminococcus sp.]
MSKFDTAGQYWREITDKLMKSKEEYANFLKFSSRIYKHDFTDAAMIYRQNPHASKVAEIGTWNKLGRRVNRGEQSIVSFGNGGKCKYLFDVSQTNGRKEPELWKLDEKLSDRLLDSLNEKNSAEWKNLNEAISKICLNTMKQTMAMGYYPDTYEKLSAEDKKKFNRSVLSSARYIASNRCQLNGSISLDTTLNLEGLDLCKSRNEFAKFASLAHGTAKSALLYMEHELFEIMKKMRSEQLAVSAPEVNGNNQSAPQDIPFSSGDIFDMEGKLYKVDSIDLANDNVSLSEINTNQTRNVSVTELSLFFTEEQKKEQAIDSAIDTILSGDSEILIENAPVTVSPDIPPLSDKNILAEIIKNGESRYERNSDIESFFAENHDLDLRAGYISSIYRDDSVQMKINGVDFGFKKTENGLEVWQGTAENREKQSVLSWDTVQAVIAGSVEKGIFNNVPEKKREDLSQIGNENIEKFFSEDVTDMESETVSANVRNIRCETAEEAEQLFDYLRDNGYTWQDGEDLTVTEWFYGEHNTFYSVDSDNMTVERRNTEGYTYDNLRTMNVEDFSFAKDEFVSGKDFTEPEQTAEKKYDLVFSHSRSCVNVYDFSESRDSEPIAVIDSDRNVVISSTLPKSVENNIYEYANGMAEIYTLPEIREPRPDEPTVTITFSETPSPFNKGITMPFSQADEIFRAADKNYTESRNNPYSSDNFTGYSKVDFTIKGGSDKPDFEYKGRYDLGDGENGLMNHIRNMYEYIYPDVNLPSEDENPDNELESERAEYKEFLDYLDKHLNGSVNRSGEWFVQTSENQDGLSFGYIAKKLNENEPANGKNLQYCTNYFSDESSEFNIAYAKELADKLNKQGISDLQQAREFVNHEIASREKELGIAEEPESVSEEQGKYDVRITRARNADRGVSSHISSANYPLEDSYTVGTYNSYDEAAGALKSLRQELDDSAKKEEYFNLCPYREREISRGFEVNIDGTDYLIYEIDRENNTVELAKPEDIDTSVSYIQRNESNKPPVRTESFEYINSLFNEKSVIAPKTAKNADELAVGDIIRFESDTWRISKFDNFSVSLENTDKTANNSVTGIWGNWRESLTQTGFEYLGHEEPELKENVSRSDSRKVKEDVPIDGQLNLFGEDYSNEPTVPKEYPQNVIDDFLRCGGYDNDSAVKIIAQYQKGKSDSENAEFLKNEFKDFTDGHISDGEKYSIVCDDEGIHINSGDTAFGKDSKVISWDESAKRINELLESGRYAPQEKLESAKDFSFREAATAICYIYGDIKQENRKDFFIDEETLTGNYPEMEEKVSEKLHDVNELEKYIKSSEEFTEKCRENDYLRFGHQMKAVNNLPKMLADLQGKPREFSADSGFDVHVRGFITKDEIHKRIMSGSNYENSKNTVSSYFSDGHTREEKINFLKDHYGLGGTYSQSMGVSYDGKGIKISHQNPYGDTAKTLVSWKTVAAEIDKAISSGEYIPDKTKAENKGKTAGKARETSAPKNQPEPSENTKDTENIFTVNSAIKSNYEGMVTLYGADERVYLGKSENYDSMGHYDNSDNSLVYISDNDKMFDFLSLGAGWVKSQQEMLDVGGFTLEDYREFSRLQETVLSKYTQISDVTFDGKKFQPVSDKTVLVSPDKNKGENYRFKESDVIDGGQKTKYRANAEAIKTLLTVEREKRPATPAEQSVMAGYSGWGGMPQAFDRHNENWTEEYNELRKLLSSSEYSAARASSLTSFYTPPQVTDGVYQALEQFGFKGGNVLEPSMGVGNFFAKMPDSMADNSRLYGVELDSISGRIAKQLYPNANIQIKGFEETSFSDNSFDVALGNIPFGDMGVYDKAYNKHNFKIHDYFAAKAADKVKPGGVIALVTSKFTMDKQDEKARRYLAERCDLLGAVRLPAGTFKDADNVTTDILFLQKRDTRSIEVPNWVHMSETPDGVPCNKYFVDNPDMVLGKMEFDKRMQGKYGADSKVTVCSPTEGDFAEKLKNAIAKIKGEISVNMSIDSKEKDTANVIPAEPSVRNFTHTMINGELYHRRNEVMVKTEATGKSLERMIGLHNIRQAAMEVITAQAENCSDNELANLQNKLNKLYDDFRKKFGCISDKANAKVFSQDDDYNTLCAFEITDKETKEVKKADIFFKRTITAEEEIHSVNTPDEALQVSLDRTGKVDIPYMAKLLDKSPDETIDSLGDSIFVNPAKIKSNEPYSGYEESSEYLSGNVREKLDIAKAYAETVSPEYEKNVSALEKVLPETIQAEDIAVRIGVNWIENKDYSKFMKDVLQLSTWDDRLTRTIMGEYKIENKYSDRSVAAANLYGTPRMNSTTIFENLLNNRDIVVKDPIEDENGNKKYVINQKETQLAKNKARTIGDEFKKWFWKDMDRREYYVEKYNRLFNSIRGREYDGSHQTFPGMNPAIKLRSHQQNAVLRAKLGSNTLLAHCVGAGKSFEMDAAVMEKKRLGLISKACVVVPKHLTLQTAYEWQRLYPNAKLLVATPNDFKPDTRQQFIGKCVTGDYDAVIMSYNQFERIPMSNSYRENFIQSQIDEIDEAIENTDRNDRVTIKQLEREKIKLEIELKKLLDSPKDNSLNFEQLGFDYLVVDEAHNYKNCLVISKMSNVAGVQTTSAKKSADMLMKTQFLNEKYGYGNVLWATGTPVSNSMVELYSMTRYLRPDLLKKAGLDTFDDWASTFGEVVSQLELKPAGDGFRMKNRFSKFVNLPELMQMYKEFADIRMPDSLDIPGIPEMKTGKPIIVTAKPDLLQQAYMKELAKRSEAIQAGGVDPREDNMLKITHEARLLGLDSRTINRDFVPSPDSKVNMLLDNLEKIRTQTDKEKGVQIVFCDIAIHEDTEHFSVYNAIKQGLKERGIPEKEICFAGDAKTDTAKAKMYDELRSGEKRFIIASTSKLGTGANIQDRVAAIHHLDIPWRPADLEQQNGRGLRQGNRFSEVGIYHYVTEGTFDAYMLGIITAKAKFISQIMTSKNPARTCEDVDEMVLNYAVMSAVATGNPALKRRIELQNEISELKVIEADYNKNLYKMQELSEKTLPQAIKRDTKLLEKAKDDLQTYKDNKPEEFEIVLNGTKYTERTEAGKVLEEAILKCGVTNESQKLGTYAGFEISVVKNPDTSSLFNSPCLVKLHGKLDHYCDVSLKNDVGNIRRIENLAENSVSGRIMEISNNIKQAEENLAAAEEALSKPFEHEEKLRKDIEELAKVDAELGTDKTDDFAPVDSSMSGGSGESEDESEDISEKREKLFTVKKFDISGLQQPQEQEQKQQAPAAPDCDEPKAVRENTERKKNKSL